MPPALARIVRLALRQERDSHRAEADERWRIGDMAGHVEHHRRAEELDQLVQALEPEGRPAT